ncbi:MAG: hypothetical protein JNK47_12715 [Mesorhizobium sp.]|nr:hypothetical protein [Mesorhizobium sp.]MBL8578082.1 hypothetical protein [Mesorhizobium sp.]
MCLDPLTLLTVVGTGISTAGALAQGQQQAQMAEYQARAQEQQAQADAQATAFETAREKRRQDLLRANAVAQAGASGVALEGSPTAVLLTNARENELDLQAIRYGAQLRQNNMRTQASITRYSGKQARTASIFSAGSNLVSGLSNLYDPNRAAYFGRSPFAQA